uniref:Synaptotagmin like 1 n=1 Tax=Suricata suricatta TaxID=37032 RepID=A0A673UDN5_SURSU
LGASPRPPPSGNGDELQWLPTPTTLHTTALQVPPFRGLQWCSFVLSICTCSSLLASPVPLATLIGTQHTKLYSHSLTLDGVSPVSHQLEDPLSPVPSLSCFHRWFFPIIGHMGICTSTGVIRDFAGPYFVSDRPGGQCGQKDS